eukprot:gnl/MRDRNA2_/MRDRNA2_77541_c0_seq1.p1 gnl/MRDRNA2_/MRDRNA2_77541_c0~~gnl/MRDRNA2_/MRDRNA2_77541_c0_seq1.p1  ORF type:complete len:690 (+),score=105.27 gnl/MRDRNA2_/MRDRNA2_77541_c0_seq1:69-2138(+)
MVQRRRTSKDRLKHLGTSTLGAGLERLGTASLGVDVKQATGSESHEQTSKVPLALRILEFLLHHFVFFKPALIALAPTLVAVALKSYLIHNPAENVPDALLPNTDLAYSSLSWVLGIVLVFRTGQAYSRYWDAAKGLHAMTVELFDACAQVVSFAESSDASRQQVDAFQLAIIRLFSLLHGVALQRVAELPDEDIQVIDQGGLDTDQIKFMCGYSRKARPEIVMQWVLRTINEAGKSGIVQTPPPIVSRVYQELNSGFCALAQMGVIADIPFPIPYAKMVWLLLGAHITITPFYAVAFTNATVWAGLFAFIAVFSTWCIQFIGIEMEMPFGDNTDDLDLASAQNDFNDLLLSLLQLETQWTPNLDVTYIEWREKCSVRLSRLQTGFFPQDSAGADNGTYQLPAPNSPTCTSLRRLKAQQRLSWIGEDCCRGADRRPSMTIAIPSAMERSSAPSVTGAVPFMTVTIPSEMERSSDYTHGPPPLVEESRNSKGVNIRSEENGRREDHICGADEMGSQDGEEIDGSGESCTDQQVSALLAPSRNVQGDSIRREQNGGGEDSSSSESKLGSQDRGRISRGVKFDVDQPISVLPTPTKLLRGCNLPVSHSRPVPKRRAEVSCTVDELERLHSRGVDERERCCERIEKVQLTTRQRELTSKILQSNEHCLQLFTSIAAESVVIGAKVEMEGKLSV